MGAKKKRYYARDGHTTAALLHYARDHIASAGVLFAKSYSCFDSGAHLSHLGLELMLKAVLFEASGSFPNEHDLIAIFKELRLHNPTFSLPQRHLKTLALVSRFVELRYPDPKGSRSLGDSHWKRIQALYAAIAGAMPTKLQEELRRVDPTKKGGRVLMERRLTEWERAQRALRVGV
jgi:HEPN domain-containing protein